MNSRSHILTSENMPTFDAPCATVFAGSYCALCDEYFTNYEQREHHIQETAAHVECSCCMRRFLNKKIMRQHCATAPGHYYCVACNKHFLSPAALQVHIDDVDHTNLPPPSYDADDVREEERSRNWGEEERIAEERYPELFAQKVTPSGAVLSDEERYMEAEDSYDFTDKTWLASMPEHILGELEPEEDCDEPPSKICCPLCEKDKQEMCATQCGHVYCVGCTMSVMKYTGECPTCDQQLDENMLRRIYLD